MSNLPQLDVKSIDRFYIVLLIDPNSRTIFLDLPEQSTKLIFFIATKYIKFSKCLNTPFDCNIVDPNNFCLINIYDNLPINKIISKLLKHKVVYIKNCEIKPSYLKTLKIIKTEFEKKWQLNQ